MQSVAGEERGEHTRQLGKVGLRYLALIGGVQGRMPAGSNPVVQVRPSKVTSVKGNVKVTTAC